MESERQFRNTTPRDLTILEHHTYSSASFLRDQTLRAQEPEASFNRAVRITDEKRSDICSQRGGEYLDSWAIENTHTAVLDATLREIGDKKSIGAHESLRDVFARLTEQEKRLIVIAALCDVKLSRYGGAFKDDTPIDLCNYLMAHTTWLNEYLGR